MTDRKIALRLTVFGRVQGVFFRDWTVAAARELGLTGWVRNEAGGGVAALLQGDAGAVHRMLERMHSGPPTARVERIDQQAGEPEDLASFERR